MVLRYGKLILGEFKWMEDSMDKMENRTLNLSTKHQLRVQQMRPQVVASKDSFSKTIHIKIKGNKQSVTIQQGQDKNIIRTEP